MTETLEAPDWLQPGRPVVAVGGYGLTERATVTTVRKVNKQSVTLEDGQRFNLRGADSGELVHYGQRWDPSTHLYPVDSEPARRALAAQERRVAIRKADIAADAFRKGPTRASALAAAGAFEAAAGFFD